MEVNLVTQVLEVEVENAHVRILALPEELGTFEFLEAVNVDEGTA